MLLLITGIYIVISSETWFMIWVGIEINFLGFIFILSKIFFTNSVVKYFLIQVIASSLFLRLSFNRIKIVYLPLLIKLGSVPFHMWLPQIAIELSWFNIIIRLSLQKIIPLIIMTSVYNPIIVYFIIINAITGSIIIINQIQVKLILTYSSISNTAWILVPIGLLFFTIYSLGLIILVISLNKIWIRSQVSIIPWYLKFSIILNLFSRGGIPPLTGFFPKIRILMELAPSNTLLALILLLSSSINIYRYVRIANRYLITYYNIIMEWNYNKIFIRLYLIWPRMGRWFMY